MDLKTAKKHFTGWCPTCAKTVSVISKEAAEQKRKLPITKAAAKAKGRKAQQQVAAILAAASGLLPEDFESVSGGRTGQDIRLTDAARKRWPFHAIEVTADLSASVWAKFRQAQGHAQKQLDGETPGNGRPILIFKKNGTPLFAMLLLDDLVAGLQEKTAPVTPPEAENGEMGGAA